MASITWRNRTLGRGSQVVALMLAVVVVCFFTTRSTWNSCVCPHPSLLTKLDDRPLGIRLNTLQKSDRAETRTAHQDMGKGLFTTPFSAAEQVFEDLKPETSEYLIEDGDDPGMPDIMSNLSLADIKHITWGKELDAEAFTAWAHYHVMSNVSSTFVLPKIQARAERACSSETELIIVVPSVPEHVFIRELVRQTWAGTIYGMPWPRRQLHLKTGIVFVLGIEGLAENKLDLLKEESDDYGDLVTASFVDSYRNLTLKMITGLDWVARFCSSASYILKCDLDTFVNLPLMTRLLKSVGEKLPRFVMGGRHETLNPPVLRSGRWGISKEVYPFPVYPPYVMGHSYVLTAGLAPQMVRLAHKIPIAPSEDSFITGVMACILKATRLYHDAFANNFKRPLPCNIIFNEDVSMTKMSMSHLLLMWRHVLTNTCSAQELSARGNMVVEPGKKKQQQLKAADHEENQKQQVAPNSVKETKQEGWKSPWEINDKNNNINQFQQLQDQEPRQIQGQNIQQFDKLKFNSEAELLTGNKIGMDGKEQKYHQQIGKGPWQKKFDKEGNNFKDIGRKTQRVYENQQNQENAADRREDKLLQQENEILQQLLN